MLNSAATTREICPLLVIHTVFANYTPEISSLRWDHRWIMVHDPLIDHVVFRDTFVMMLVSEITWFFQRFCYDRREGHWCENISYSRLLTSLSWLQTVKHLRLACHLFLPWGGASTTACSLLLSSVRRLLRYAMCHNYSRVRTLVFEQIWKIRVLLKLLIPILFIF